MEKGNTPDVLLKRPYARVLVPNDDATYTAEIAEFPGCIAEGDNPNAAINALETVARSWIEDCLDQGLPIPEPEAENAYAGKVALRLPRSIHRDAARMAARDNVSLNQFLVTAIAARVGAEDLCARLVKRIEEKQERALKIHEIASMQASSTMGASLSVPIDINWTWRSAVGMSVSGVPDEHPLFSASKETD